MTFSDSYCAKAYRIGVRERFQRRMYPVHKRIIMTDSTPYTYRALFRTTLPCLMGCHDRESDSLPWKTAYFAFINATVVSSIRLEKPHSLSYQEQALTRVPPVTRVSVASKLEVVLVWLKSTETSGPAE